MVCAVLALSQRTSILFAATSPQDTIEGVQPAALDQPRIYVNLRRDPKGETLHTSDKDAISGVEAFLDTGASGIMLSADTIDKLGVHKEAIAGKAVEFQDVGVGGGEKFGVSEKLFVALANYPKSDPENSGAYSKPIGPFRTQIKSGGGLIDLIEPGMDVAGMPVMDGKVVVLDPTPLVNYDKISTAVFQPGDKQIPKTKWRVPLTMVSFARFTQLQPHDAQGPDLLANPMIGPDPFTAGDSHKPVVVRYKGKTVTGTFLLDTGAATSMISTKLANQLGVDLAKIPQEQQFQLAVGGVGGANQSSGIFFDRLELPTVEGRPIVYTKAPLLISDITVADSNGKTYTIDGVFGVNYLVASAEITGGLLPDVGKIVNGPFKRIVIDFKQNLLGLDPAGN